METMSCSIKRYSVLSRCVFFLREYACSRHVAFLWMLFCLDGVSFLVAQHLQHFLWAKLRHSESC